MAKNRLPGYKTLIDRYAQIAVQVKELNNQKDALKADILIKMEDVDPESFIALQNEPDILIDLYGKTHMITISSQAKNTVIPDMHKVRKKLSAKDFWDNTTIPIGTLKEIMSPKQVKSVTGIERGSRKWNAKILPEN